MIIRKYSGFHFLLPQAEHARQCAMIVSSLRTEFLGDGDRQAEILCATRHHDDGWIPWDENPDFGPDGLPINFLDMNSRTHHEIWDRSVFTNLRLRGPAITAIVARHGMELMHHDEGQRAQYAEVIAALKARAWPTLSDADATRRVDAGFAALYFADGLSLAANTGMDKKWSFELLRDGAEPLMIHAWLERDWTVRVDPWPFCTDRLTGIFVDVIAVPCGQEAFTRDCFFHGPECKARVMVDYLPA